MKKIIEIINQLEDTSSTNSKISILKENKDNELLRRVLKYTYDPNMKYKLTSKTIQDRKISKARWEDIFSCLYELSVSNINDELRLAVGDFLNRHGSDLKDLYTKMILKDLQCKISIKTLNKVWPGIIEDFSVMKADSYDDNMDSFNKKAEKEGYIMMLKKNGIRGEIIKETGKVTIKSRQNKIITGLIEIEEAFKDWDNGFYEGEFLAFGDFKTSAEQFKETDKIYSSKGEKKGLYIELFDYIPLLCFDRGEDKTICKDRKENVKKMVLKHNSTFIKYAEPIYEGKDTSLIINKLKEVTKDNKEEGLMVALSNGTYQAKKVKQIIKVKEFYTMDLLVTDVVEGDKPATIGKMGKAVVDFKGNPVGVGGGWSMKEREHYWNHPEDIIGKILEVKYKEITCDKNGKESLQFPIRVRIREDGKEVSYS